MTLTCGPFFDRYGHNGKPTAPEFSHDDSATDGRTPSSNTLGNALLGILPGSLRGTTSPRGQSVPTSARHQEKKQRPNIPERTAENQGDGDSMIALANFGERPRYPPRGDSRRAHAGESARSDSGSGTTTEHSEARSWKTGGTANLGMSSASMLSWGYNITASEASRTPGSPTTVTSNVSDGQNSQWTAKPGQRSNLGAPIMSRSSDTPVLSSGNILRAPENSSTSSLTATQLTTQRQRQEDRPFSPARSDATGYSASEAAAYANRHKDSRSRSSGSGSGGYALPTAHPATGAGAGGGVGGGPQPLKPPPRTDRDRERERLERIEREERERQERLASSRYDLVGVAKDRSRLPAPPPPYSSTVTTTSRPSFSSTRVGDIGIGTGTGTGILPPTNFDRDLEVARAGSPSNTSARSKYSARGTVGTGTGTGSVREYSVREYSITPDLSAPQTGNQSYRSYTPDDRFAGGRFTPER